MKILITGANGLIARKVIRQLLSTSKHQVVATSQKALPLDLEVEAFTVNLVYADVNNLIDRIKPDVVIHCAAMGSPDACEADRFKCKSINIDATVRIANACKDYGTHFIFLSTDFVFDGIKGDYTEEDIPSPISYYGESKLEAEKIVSGLNIGAAIVRTSLVFGYDEKLARQNIVLKVVETLKKNKQYRVPFDQIRTPTFAEDISSAIIRIAESRAEGVFNISGSEKISVADFAKLTAKVFKLNETLLIPVSTKELTEPAQRPLNTSLIISKAQKELDYKPTPIEDALQLVMKQCDI